MKLLNKSILVAVLLLSVGVYAHDPKEHAKNAEKANCGSMGSMKKDADSKDAKMDMSDPVMMAMMKKCMKQKMNADANDDDDDHQSAGSDNDEKGEANKSAHEEHHK